MLENPINFAIMIQKKGTEEKGLVIRSLYVPFSRRNIKCGALAIFIKRDGPESRLLSIIVRYHCRGIELDDEKKFRLS